MISKRKILIIVIFILFVILMGMLLYYTFFKKPTVPIPEPEVVGPPARLPDITKQEWERMTVEQRMEMGLPAFEWEEPEVVEEIPPAPLIPLEEIVPRIDEVAQGGKTWITPISKMSIMEATLSSDGKNSVYYDKRSGYFYKIDSLGNKELFSDQAFHNVQDINWAPTKDRAILEYPDGFKVMYDFNKKKQYTLPKNWEDFSWNSAGSEIAFKSMSKYEENTWLAIAKPDGSYAKPIEHMGKNADKVTVSWSPNNQVIAFSETGDPRGTWEQEILLIGQHQENFKSLVIDGRGLEVDWSPIGDKISYSVYSGDNNYNPRLYIVNAQGEQIGKDRIDTGLNTWAHKCTFNNTGLYVYCAAPRDLPEGSGMIPEIGQFARDDFYKINARTGKVTFLAEGAMGGYNVKNIYLSDDQQYLYFTDKNTGTLRHIRLK